MNPGKVILRWKSGFLDRDTPTIIPVGSLLYEGEGVEATGGSVVVCSVGEWMAVMEEEREWDLRALIVADETTPTC
jgi:hypothetical protein